MFLNLIISKLQQHSITRQPWRTEFSEHTNLVNKIVSNLASPTILQTQLRPFHINYRLNFNKSEIVGKFWSVS